MNFKHLISFILIGLISQAGFSQKYSPNRKTYTISTEELHDKIAGAWIGQLIGNIYGLPHENKYVDAPGPEDWPYGYRFAKNLEKMKQYNGAFSDDDTDLEYMYLLEMEKHGYEPTYKQLTESWIYHIRDRIWLANRGALGLMHFGFTPPFTGSKDINPHWYQIDPQLINEIWAFTAPGMVRYASQKSDWAARITSDDWAIEPTIHYGAMYSAAFFETDIRKLIEIGINELPAGSRYAQTIRHMIELHKKYPNHWQSAWQEMAQKYYIDEPDMTKTIWNANLNGACGILAMLYGEGDFQRTLDLSCAMGFDADNQAATVAGLMGIMYGFKALPEDLYLPLEGWTKPFNDTYINITRHDMPDASIQDMINRMYKITLDLVIGKGGKLSQKSGKEVLTINARADFNPPLEFNIGPMPRMEKGKYTEYSFPGPVQQKLNWTILSGKFPEGITFENGRIKGTPVKPGIYPVTLQIDNGKEKVSRELQLLVRNENIAPLADSVIANIRDVNRDVLDSCWVTFGKSMYANHIEVIRDGVTGGPGSVFYSLAAKAKLPKVDYYGYSWSETQEIDMIAFFTGGMEEFGGWFTSLNVQYMDEAGKWWPVEKIQITPPLPETDIVFFQPHFVEYVIAFKPVKTKAIRIIGDTKIQDHWNQFTKHVSGFSSITELSIYKTEK